jgi:hypothetical protein
MYPEDTDVEPISRAKVRHINSGKPTTKKKEKLVVNKSRKSCEDKRRFRSIDEAKRGLQASRNRARIDITETGATRLHAQRYYLCPKCRGYHLTSKPEFTSGKAA